jgi:hypothetical protein
MSQQLLSSTHSDKSAIYAQLLAQIEALSSGEPDLIAVLANISAALKMTFDWLWVGFYLVQPPELVFAAAPGNRLAHCGSMMSPRFPDISSVLRWPAPKSWCHYSIAPARYAGYWMWTPTHWAISTRWTPQVWKPWQPGCARASTAARHRRFKIPSPEQP